MADIFQGLPDLNTEAKIPNNIEVTTDMFSDLLPDEEKYKFKLTTEGNRGSNLSDKDKTEPASPLPDIKSVESKKQSDIFDGLKLPEENKKNSGYLKALMALSPLTSIGEKTEDLVDDIDEDSTNLKKIAYAAQLGFFDTYQRC